MSAAKAWFSRLRKTYAKTIATSATSGDVAGMQHRNSSRHLPRLSAEAYRGHQFVHWIMTIAGRRTGWLTSTFHARFRETLTACDNRYSIAVPIYCLMPDHLHLLAAGLTLRADQLLWARSLRRSTNVSLPPSYSLQKQSYDHVLRPSEIGLDALATLIAYITENPVRAGLAATPQAWPHIGSNIPALNHADPREPDFTQRWWSFWNSRRTL